LKYAGCEFLETNQLSDINSMDLAPFSEQLLKQQALTLEKYMPKLGEKILKVEQISYSYGDNEVLHDISFTVRKGERLAFIGKNGAGKSTMAKLICGIIRPSKGNIYVGDQNYLQLSMKEIGERIGYVMQNPNQMLVKDMIKDEVELAMVLRGKSRDEINDAVKKALKMCGLWGMRNWPVAAVSYGQRKRVTIASILVLQPEIIILDEPTAGQDYFHYTEIMNFLDDLNKQYGITVIFITHDMHLAIQYTDRAVVFSDGELIADDTVYKVLADNAAIEKANLKQTSLYTLAKRLGISPEDYIEHFISYERMRKEYEQPVVD
jgi:energy-coupling factor transport system ATP-binding protein